MNDNNPIKKTTAYIPPPTNSLHIEKLVLDTVLQPPKSKIEESVFNPNVCASNTTMLWKDWLRNHVICLHSKYSKFVLHRGVICCRFLEIWILRIRIFSPLNWMILNRGSPINYIFNCPRNLLGINSIIPF